MDGQAISTFEGGMNSDLGKTLQHKNSYLEALNFRITTEDGQSTGILSNVKGNALAISFPNTTTFLKWTLDIPIAPSYIFIDNTFGNTYTFTYTGSGNVYDQLALFLNTSTNFPTLGISAFSYSTYVGLYSKNFSDLTTLITLPTGVIETIIVPSQTDLTPIGSTNIRDEIIVLTTSKNNIIPHQDGINPNIGQIWKLTYDASQIDVEPLPPNIFTLELLYNNALDFSLTHPIAPTAIRGNYENTNIKKIYWCDDYNKIRNFNTADPIGFFTDVSLIDSEPTVNMSIPILQTINEGNGGVLNGSTYQYTYRLLKINGATTVFSPLSNIINIVPDSEHSAQPVLEYVNDSFGIYLNTHKSVTIKILDVDVDYDRIQVAYVRRDHLTPGVADRIAIFSDEPIDKTSGIAIVTHFGNETSEVAITNAELTNPSRSPNIAKTMAIKDSVLFIGNTKVSKLDLNYDARVFRWTGLNNTTSPGTPNTYPHGTLPDIQDDINPDQTPTSFNNYLYQSDGLTFGGSGANISYKFVTLTHPEDNMQGLVTTIPYRSYSVGTFTENLGIPGQDFVNQQFLQDSTSPYMENIFRGYQRGETYRFGITFFDKAGFPTFTKWIGDIRIPDIYMPTQSLVENPTLDPLTRSSAFSITTDDPSPAGVPVCYAHDLGVEFKVNISSISSQISGYSIVRVKRTQGDKSIVAQGLLQPAYYDNGVFLQNYTYENDSPATAITKSYAYDVQFGSIVSPEFHFGTFGRVSGDGGNDIIEIVDRIYSANGHGQAALKAAATPVSNGGVVQKFYVEASGAILDATYRQNTSSGGGIGKRIELREAFYIDSFHNNPNKYHDGLTGNDLINTCPRTIYQTTQAVEGGSMETFLANNSALNDYSLLPNWFNTDSMIASDTRYYLVNYRRNIANQYGGNSLTDRSNNDYISCNHFQPTNDLSTILTSIVMGGDVYINLYDNNLQRRGINEAAGNTGLTASVTKFQVGVIFACESCINIGLRSKTNGEGSGGLTPSHPTLNTCWFTETGTFLDDNDDTGYNNIFNEENDIMTFLPKPIPFIEQDVFDNRVYGSQVKINGELEDSWGIFPPSDYRDVDGTYGPINGLIAFNNQLHFIQDRAVGVIPVFPRAVLNNAGIVDAQLQLGLGPKLDKHQYISTDTGTKHQWSFINSNSALYWYDVLAKKQYSYSPGKGDSPLSDIKGMHAFFDRQLIGQFMTNDNPILEKGVCAIYDYKNNEIISTYHDISSDGETKNKFTISYNELTNCYTSLYSFKPTIYLTNRQIYLSPDPDASNVIYVHSKGSYSNFYNRIYPSTIKLIVNENPLSTKVFDNQVFETEAIGTLTGDLVNINDSNFHSVRFYNDYQNTNFQNLITDITIKRRERSVNIAIPRNRVLYTIGGNSPDIFTNLSYGPKPFGERIRDKYLTCDYQYDNTDGWWFKVHNIKTQYRISAR